jgi:1-acyl-sn-glycerol-3-phosphate acyltransferase
MIFRVVKILWFMLKRMVEYSMGAAFGTTDLEAKLERDYRAWSAYVLGIFTVDFRVEGREHIPPRSGRKIVIVSNHQSQLDIPSLARALDQRIGFVAKKELGSIPVLSYWMRKIGCVFIDRADRKNAHRALEQAAESMGPHPLVVFPEGTRSKDGNLLPAKTGGFRLAQMAGAQVLPVLIQGSRDAVENRAQGLEKSRGGPIPVRVRIFPALDVKDYPPGKDSLGRMKDYVEACWRS